jgi:hypothetical protein
MNQTAEAQILDAEDRLRAAMLSSDVVALDTLLATDLIFTNHLGQLLGKENDLAAYRSGVLKVTELRSSEQHVRFSAGGSDCLGKNATVGYVQWQSGEWRFSFHPCLGSF